MVRSCDLLTDPTHRPFSNLTGWLICGDSTMLFEKDYWLATIFLRNPPIECRGMGCGVFCSSSPQSFKWWFLQKPENQTLRIFQHTPGTYPKPLTNSLWKNSFHLGGLGMPGLDKPFGTYLWIFDFPGHPDGLCVGVTLTHPEETRDFSVTFSSRSLGKKRGSEPHETTGSTE